MKIRVGYAKLVNTGNYENIRLLVEIEDDHDKNFPVEEQIKNMTGFCRAELKRRLEEEVDKW